MNAVVMCVVLAMTSTDASEAYRAGRYEEALGFLEVALAAEDGDAGTILNDMGNCAFRLNRFAEAIWYYRRARLRHPRDDRIAFNLRLAEDRLGIEPPVDDSLVKAIALGLARWTQGELVLLAIMLKTLGLVGFVALRRRSRWRGAAIVVVVLGVAIGARVAYVAWFAEPAGVVLEGEVRLRAAPRTEEDARLSLTAGDTVRVVSISDDWVEIEHDRGRGWTESSGVGVVD